MSNNPLLKALETPSITLIGGEADRYIDNLKNALSELENTILKYSQELFVHGVHPGYFLLVSRAVHNGVVGTNRLLDFLKPSVNGIYDSLKVDAESGFPMREEISRLIIDGKKADEGIESVLNGKELKDFGRKASERLLSGEYPEREIKIGTTHHYFLSLKSIKEHLQTLGNPVLMEHSSRFEGDMYDPFEIKIPLVSLTNFDITKNLFVCYILDIPKLLRYRRIQSLSGKIQGEVKLDGERKAEEINSIIASNISCGALENAVEQGFSYPPEIMFDVLRKRGLKPLAVARLITGPFFFYGIENPEVVQDLIGENSYIFCFQYEYYPTKDSHNQGELGRFLMRKYSCITDDKEDAVRRRFLFVYSPDIAEILGKDPKLKERIFGDTYLGEKYHEIKKGGKSWNPPR